MWLRRIDSDGLEFRYELETYDSQSLMLPDGGQTQIFLVYKYYKDNNGEFQRCSHNSKVYVTIETLLSSFILIDSPIDEKLIKLNKFKLDTYSKKLEESLKPFCFNKTEEVRLDNDVDSIIPQ